MCAPLVQGVILLDSTWLPVVRGVLRLFESGLAISSPRHGPLVLPFRIHLSAVATYHLGCLDGYGLLVFRQKPDTHGYGPLALLPAALGGEHPDVEAPRPLAMSVAIVVPGGSELQRALCDVVWPMWARLFRELGVPCDDLPAVPSELRMALAQFESEEAAGWRGVLA